mmetsp:Transcript_25079/g.56607  ORF Transcript_25079/g.56607 Transcript_25079/m.56607 type:complete len:204 (-) Transcript_25079:591-1202(-)
MRASSEDAILGLHGVLLRHPALIPLTLLAFCAERLNCPSVVENLRGDGSCLPCCFMRLDRLLPTRSLRCHGGNRQNWNSCDDQESRIGRDGKHFICSIHDGCERSQCVGDLIRHSLLHPHHVLAHHRHQLPLAVRVKESDLLLEHGSIKFDPQLLADALGQSRHEKMPCSIQQNDRSLNEHESVDRSFERELLSTSRHDTREG